MMISGKKLGLIRIGFYNDCGLFGDKTAHVAVVDSGIHFGDANK